MWSKDLKLSKKKSKKITLKLIKKAFYDYLKKDNIDSKNIIETFKWDAYKDTFVKDSIINYILKVLK